MGAIRHAFREFLLVPTCIIAGFLLLAAGTNAIDRGNIGWLEPGRSLLRAYVFADFEAAASMLRTVAAQLITVTALTTSLLLVALQQSASSLTHQVYDQFLRRPINQFSLGFFVGFSLYALVTLATVGPLNPVFGAALTVALTIVALYLLLVLFYTTIDQMRPVVIIETLHDHILAARKCQQDLIRKTRRTSRFDATVRVQVTPRRHGFVTRIDIGSLGKAAARAGAEVEVVLNVSIGTWVAFGDVLAEVRAHHHDDARTLGEALHGAISRQGQRDLANDPLNGIEELATIAWTTISTAHSDRDPGQLTIRSLRDVLACWSSEPPTDTDAQHAPVLYRQRDAAADECVRVDRDIVF